MKSLAIALLLGVFLRHDSAFLLADVTGRAPTSMFYIMGGAWEIALCAALLLFLSASRRDVWTSLAQAACVIGIIEGAMIAGCRLALDAPPPAGTTACNAATGLPIGAVIATMEVIYVALIVGWYVGRWTKGEST